MRCRASPPRSAPACPLVVSVRLQRHLGALPLELQTGAVGYVQSKEGCHDPLSEAEGPLEPPGAPQTYHEELQTPHCCCTQAARVPMAPRALGRHQMMAGCWLWVPGSAAAVASRQDLAAEPQAAEAEE